MEYESPFRLVSGEHDGEDHLCLSRSEHSLDAAEDNLTDFWEAFTCLATTRADPEPPFLVPGPVLFFLGRHITELALKQWLPTGTAGHKLNELLARVAPSHPIWSDETRDLREFVGDLARCDPQGDEGRYGTKRDGSPSLSPICCMDPLLFTDYLQRLIFLDVAAVGS